MTRDMKISLTFPKQAYAVFFALVLSLVRGVAYSNEIGIALEAPMAILAFTFCADTYTQEIVSRRSEIWRLCPMKKRIHCIYRRIAVQELFLLTVAAVSYGLFFLFQNPITYIMENGSESEICRFRIYGSHGCHAWLLGDFIQSDFLPVSEYVGGNRRLPGALDDYQFRPR